MTVCYPGSFDPISNGHLDIIRRLCEVYDNVVILISNNIISSTTYIYNLSIKNKNN